MKGPPFSAPPRYWAFPAAPRHDDDLWNASAGPSGQSRIASPGPSSPSPTGSAAWPASCCSGPARSGCPGSSRCAACHLDRNEDLLLLSDIEDDGLVLTEPSH